MRLRRRPRVSHHLLARLNPANPPKIPLRRSSVRPRWWTTGLCLMGARPVLSPTVNARLGGRHRQHLHRRKGRGRGGPVPQRAAKGRRPLEGAGKALAAARNEVSLPSWLTALTEQPLLLRTCLFHHYHSLGCPLHMFSAFSTLLAPLAIRIRTWSVFLVPS